MFQIVTKWIGRRMTPLHKTMFRIMPVVTPTVQPRVGGSRWTKLAGAPTHVLCPANSVVVEVQWVLSSLGLDVCLWGADWLWVALMWDALLWGWREGRKDILCLPAIPGPASCLGLVLYVAQAGLLPVAPWCQPPEWMPTWRDAQGGGRFVFLSANSSITAPWDAVQAASHWVKLHL